MFNKSDLTHLKNLQRILAKAKIELDGVEILAAADVIRWVGLLEQRINNSIKDNETKDLSLKGEEKIIEPKREYKTESLSDKNVLKKPKKE